jgi:hypothetical protein
MKRIVLLSLLAAGALLVTWILTRPIPEPIEGVWKNDYYGVCLCSSENFYLFEDGKIVEYSDRHFTNHNAGEYKELGNGVFEVTLNHNGAPPSKWSVRPRHDIWIHPPDDNLGILRWQARRFYRPDDEAKFRALIASAPERDARFKAAIEKKKGQQAGSSNGG